MSPAIIEAEPRPCLVVGDAQAIHLSGSRRLPSALLVLLVVAALADLAWGVNHDVAGDTAAVLAWGVRPFAAVGWPVVLCLLVACGLHYFAAAGAARAAAGVRLPVGELVAIQFAAAAANRVTPAGLGGATVNGRFFHRRGLLSPGGAAAAVSAMAALGAIAGVIGFAAVLAFGSAAGLPGVGGEVPQLLHMITGLLPIPAGGWWLVPAAAVPVGVIALVPRLRRAVERRARMLRGYGTTFVHLLRRPMRVAALMSCSAAATLTFAAGFAAAATASSTGIAASSFCALMIGYMAASAACNCVPTPGGIGTADAGLVAVLAASGSSLAGAVPIVIAFRLVTFWLPALVGLGLARPLRRRGAV